MNAQPRMAVFLTALVGLILTVLPLPYYLNFIRPAFLVLTVIYWSVAAPRAGGIALGFFSGLMLDVFQGPILGEHALVLSGVACAMVFEHQKIRSKPAFQQSLIVFAVLIAYETLLWLIDGWSHHPTTDPMRFRHTLFGAIFWAPVAAILNLTNDRRR